MNHQDDRLLMRLIHGELADSDTRALDSRLDAEPELAARHRRLAAAWTDLEAPTSAGTPTDFTVGVVAATRQATGELSWATAPAWARAGMTAALILGVVMGTSFGVAPDNGQTETQLAGDIEASLVLDGPPSLAESFWLSLDESEGRLDGGERLQ